VDLHLYAYLKDKSQRRERPQYTDRQTHSATAAHANSPIKKWCISDVL